MGGPGGYGGGPGYGGPAMAAVAAAAGSCRACSAGSAAPWPATGSTTSSPAVAITAPGRPDPPTTPAPARPPSAADDWGGPGDGGGDWGGGGGDAAAAAAIGAAAAAVAVATGAVAAVAATGAVAVAAAMTVAAAGKALACLDRSSPEATAADLRGSAAALSLPSVPGLDPRTGRLVYHLALGDGVRSGGDGLSPMDREHATAGEVADGIRGDRVDALWSRPRPNVRYLTGFTGEASVLLVPGIARSWSPTAGSRPSSNRSAPAWRSTSGRSGRRYWRVARSSRGSASVGSGSSRRP